MFTASILCLSALLSTLSTALTPNPDPIVPSLSLPLLPTKPLTVRLTCYTGASVARTAVLSDCYTVVRLVLAERSILEPQFFNRSAPGRPGVINVPYHKRYKSCLFLLDTANPVDKATFMLVRAAFYAAELIQPCVARRKTPLGGQVSLEIGEFFVSIAGLGTSDGIEGGKGGDREEYIDEVVEGVRRLARGVSS